jgi:hypothetical protein
MTHVVAAEPAQPGRRSVLAVEDLDVIVATVHFVFHSKAQEAESNAVVVGVGPQHPEAVLLAVVVLIAVLGV